jgi:hypothetical protein
MTDWRHTRAALAALDAASDACDRALDEAEALAAINAYEAAQRACIEAYAADTTDRNDPETVLGIHRLTAGLEDDMRRWSGYESKEDDHV